MTSDDAALMRAVLADPDDDEPRLAYADRLAESSRIPDHARAEFIRLQMDLEALSEDTPGWPIMVARERELMDRYRAAWEKPLRDSFRPSFSSPGKWLRSHLFGAGGLWGFRRGFIEHVLAPAPTFLAEDAAILAHAPVRRVVLAHASEYIQPLAADPRLDRLKSLHLVGDMELDEDLAGLADSARSAGLTVLEFRLPRLWQDAEDLFETLRVSEDDERQEPDAFPAWKLADDPARDRLVELVRFSRLAHLVEDPAHEGELLALNEWVYLGDELADARVWAVAKGHQDLEDEDGRCRRLVLVRQGQEGELRDSPYCFGEVR